MSHLFADFQEYLDEEQTVREAIRAATKEIEFFSREIISLLQVIHCEEGQVKISQSCKESRAILEKVKGSYIKLMAIVPKFEYYRYNDHWRFVTTQMAFLVALLAYLEDGHLVTREEFGNAIGVEVGIVAKQEFHIDLEDYLVGLLQLANELARFAVNSVTFGDYRRPIEISKFVAELNAGFRSLNMKNDYLRKRYDVLKYDVKKIEEVVYDLSLRKLIPKEEKVEKLKENEPGPSVST